MSRPVKTPLLKPFGFYGNLAVVWFAAAVFITPAQGGVFLPRHEQESQTAQIPAGKTPGQSDTIDHPRTLTFERDVLPIFQANCLRCHDLTLKQGGLDLSTLNGVLAGSASGPVVSPKDPQASRLYSVVHDGIMPLDRKTKVSGVDLDTIRLWIRGWSEGQNPARAVARLDENDIVPIMLRHCTPC